MALTLVIANKAYSSWSLRPWLLLRHFDLPFDEIVIPMGHPATKADMLAHAPTGKCPSLSDGDVRVWDSLAIIEYIAETYPGIAVWPRDRVARAAARSLAAEMHSGFTALRAQMPMNFRRAPQPRVLEPAVQAAVDADVARIEAAWREARTRFGADGPFLFGAFSAADAMFAPVVNRLHAYAVPVAATTGTYMAAMAALPAWRDWQAEADAEGWRIDRYETLV